jgi:hypothetical protein
MRRNGQRERLILALLNQPGVEKAATAAGISTATAWRISKTPEFQSEYRQARRDAFSQSLGRLQQAAGAAATSLLKILVDPSTPAGIRVRAANYVLQRAESALELEDIQFRLTKLEQADKDRATQDE